MLGEFTWSSKTNSRSELYFVKVRSTSLHEINDDVLRDDLLTYSRSHAAYYEAFCPRIVSSQYIGVWGEISPQNVYFEGCCMLADISGFTKLTSKFCDEGLDGLDKLRHSTNDFLGDLVNVMCSYGGDVISFAGDAVICIFPLASSPENCRYDCCMRAVCCAYEIKDKCTAELTAHTAVSYGEMGLSILGGCEQSWAYLLSGSCVQELSQCLDDAAPREAVITNVVYAHLQQPDNSISTKLLSSGNYKVTSLLAVDELVDESLSVMLRHRKLASLSPHASPTPNDHLRLPPAPAIVKFIPLPALSAISSGSLNNLGELRVVTTLFMKLDSYSATEHKDLTSLQPFYHAMQEIIFECGGYIRQFIIDDKGCVLIVLWGVPTASFPNNCSRAVRCAAAMAAKTTSLNHTCSIGITTGTAYCGTVGSSRRQDYVAIGKTVNLAARLMIKANGGILSDETTQDCLPFDLANTLNTHEPLTLKGFESKVNCFMVRGSSVRMRMNPEKVANRDIFLARDVTLAIDKQVRVVKNMLGPSRDSSNCDSFNSPTEFFVVNGGNGLGKTTVAKYLHRQLRSENLGTVFVNLKKDQESVPFAALREIFLTLIGPENFETVEQQKHIVFDLLYDIFPEESKVEHMHQRFPVLAHMLQIDWNMQHSSSRSTDVPLSCKEATLKKYDDNDTFVVILKYLLASRHVSCIIIDDAHHMASSTWNQLLLMITMHLPVLIMLTFSDNGDQHGVDLNSYDSCDDISPSYSLRTSTAAVSGKSVRRLSNTAPSMSAISVRQSGGSTNYHALMVGYLSDIANTHILNLRPLSSTGVAKTIEAVLTPARVPHEITDKIYKLTRGNPFWVSELAKLIAECGIEAFAKLVSKGIEHNLLATCILSRYTSAQCSVVKMASVLGEEFNTSVLVHMLSPAVAEGMLTHLAVLANGGLVYRVSDELYRFQSSLISDLIYGLIPPSNASSLHFEVAKTIEANHMEDLTDHVAALAYHYSMSPKGHKHLSYKYAVAAAKQNATQFDFANVCSYLELALEVCNAQLYSELQALVESNLSLLDFLRQSTSGGKIKSGGIVFAQRLLRLRDAIQYKLKQQQQREKSFLARCLCFLPK